MIKLVRLIFLISTAVFVSSVCTAQDDSVEVPDFPLLTGCYLGQKLPGILPEVFAPGTITRSDYWEHSSPSFSPDGNTVYWSAHIGPSKQRIFYMTSRDGQWTPPAFAPFWHDRHGGGPRFSPDGQRLYFYSKHPESHLAENEFMNIWYLEKTEHEWGIPQKLPAPVNSGKSEASPSFTNDGMMYFCSARDGGFGKDDIYCSRFEHGQFVEPVNLGQAINTGEVEFGCCIAPDGSYLLFSRYIENPKGVSIYLSFKKPDGSWTVAQELSETIELCEKARFPGLSPDGKYLFFTATRDKDVKIYWVDARIIEELKPEN